MKILIAEDDVIIGRSMTIGLEQFGHCPDWIQSVADCEYMLNHSRYDVLLLDLGLPDGDGLDIVERLRLRGNTMFVLVVTARAEIEEKIFGLNSGADDYIVKPFSLAELNARLHAVARRQSSTYVSDIITHNGLRLDVQNYTAYIDDTAILLHAKEFAILKILLENPGTFFTKEQLLERLYGFDENVQSNTIEVFVYSLRKKIGKQWIKTIRGLGYVVPQNN